jgi:hypothetical protein
MADERLIRIQHAQRRLALASQRVDQILQHQDRLLNENRLLIEWALEAVNR